MAWLKQRGRTWYACWREDGRQRMRTLRTRVHREAIVRLAEFDPSRAPAAPADATALLDDFLRALRVTGRKPATLAFYRDQLAAPLERWCHVPPARWCPRMLDAWLDEHGHWSDRKRQMVVGAFKRLQRWAKAGRLDLGDVVGGRVIRVRRQEASHLSREQVAALLAAAEGDPVHLPIALAYYAGLPLGDLRTLTWAEIRWPEAIERVRAKTGLPQRIPLSAPLRAALERHGPAEGLVCAAMTRTTPSWYGALHAAQKVAGIPAAPRGHGGWHRLRHSYATHLLAAGADIATVTHLLGHAPGSTMVMRYVHADEARARAAVERAFG